MLTITYSSHAYLFRWIVIYALDIVAGSTVVVVVVEQFFDFSVLIPHFPLGQLLVSKCPKRAIVQDGQ